jgi:hypothetical protein
MFSNEPILVHSNFPRIPTMRQADRAWCASQLSRQPETTLMHEGREKAKRAHETLTARGIDVGAGFEALGKEAVLAVTGG